MKLKILDRVLLTLYTMVILMLSLGLLGLSVGLIPLEAALQWVQNMNVGLGLGLTAFAAAVIFLVVSLRLLIAGFMRGKPASTLLKHTELGAIRVSVQTLDNLAQKAVRSFAEIKDVRSMVLPEADGVRIQLNITVMPDVHMPALTQDLQQKVKQYTEELSGISVQEVQVYVDNLTSGQRSRVE